MFGLAAKITAGMGVAMLVMAGGFFWYFNHSQDRINQLTTNIAVLESNNSQLKDTIEEQNETIRNLDRQRRQDQRTILEITQQRDESQRRVSDLQQTFSRHNLEHLSLNRPGLIERIINRGTADVGKRINEVSKPFEREQLRDDD